MTNLPPNDDHLDADTHGALERFLRSGGSRETFYAANEELIPPAPPPQQPRPAAHPADAAVLNWARASWNYAAARAIAGLRKSARGRQGR